MQLLITSAQKMAGKLTLAGADEAERLLNWVPSYFTFGTWEHWTGEQIKALGKAVFTYPHNPRLHEFLLPPWRAQSLSQKTL